MAASLRTDADHTDCALHHVLKAALCRGRSYRLCDGKYYVFPRLQDGTESGEKFIVK